MEEIGPQGAVCEAIDLERQASSQAYCTRGKRIIQVCSSNIGPSHKCGCLQGVGQEWFYTVGCMQGKDIRGYRFQRWIRKSCCHYRFALSFRQRMRIVLKRQIYDVEAKIVLQNRNARAPNLHKVLRELEWSTIEALKEANQDNPHMWEGLSGIALTMAQFYFVMRGVNLVDYRNNCPNERAQVSSWHIHLMLLRTN